MPLLTFFFLAGFLFFLLSFLTLGWRWGELGPGWAGSVPSSSDVLSTLHTRLEHKYTNKQTNKRHATNKQTNFNEIQFSLKIVNNRALLVLCHSAKSVSRLIFTASNINEEQTQQGPDQALFFQMCRRTPNFLPILVQQLNKRNCVRFTPAEFQPSTNTTIPVD